MQLQRLRPEHVQSWHGTLIESGLSPRTVKHAHKLLHRVLTDAVKNGTVARNIAAVHAPPAVQQDEIEILTPEQIADVLAKLEVTTYFPSYR
jgi:site-specific recombinase XerD